jgi:hypothetical protein
VTSALVVAIGVAAGHAASDITACGNIAAPGSYRLANNLTAAGDCLIINGGVPNVTIDLNGHTISGDGTNGSGISGVLIEGLTLRNGTIKGFDRGVNIFGNTILIDHMTIIRNVAFGVVTIEDTIVKDSILAGNGAGLWLGAGGLASGNVVNFNTGTGIQVGEGALVTGNNVSFNGLEGINAQGQSTISNNIVRRNTGVGIRAVCPSNIMGNTSSGNPGGNLVTSGAGCGKLHNVALPKGK